MPAAKKQTDIVSQFRGDRKYRVKKETLNLLLTDYKLPGSPTLLAGSKPINDFEKHLLQEGIKQILFCEGREYLIETGNHGISFNQVPKEMIRFLLDYDVIEEFLFSE